jgi:hypothetical protein
LVQDTRGVYVYKIDEMWNLIQLKVTKLEIMEYFINKTGKKQLKLENPAFENGSKIFILLEQCRKKSCNTKAHCYKFINQKYI